MVPDCAPLFLCQWRCLCSDIYTFSYIMCVWLNMDWKHLGDQCLSIPLQLLFSIFLLDNNLLWKISKDKFDGCEALMINQASETHSLKQNGKSTIIKIKCLKCLEWKHLQMFIPRISSHLWSTPDSFTNPFS